MSKKPFSFVLIHLAGLLSACAVFADDTVLPSSYSSLDADRDGVVSEAEYLAQVVAQAKAEFRRLDRNGSGTLQADELGAATDSAPAAKAAGGPGFLRRPAGSNPQAEALRKRISSGPSMRQGGR